MSNIVFSQRKRNWKCSTPLGLLRQLTSNLDFGEKVRTKDGKGSKPIHLNPNEKVVEFLEGKRRYLEHGLSGQKLADHCSGHNTFYYASSGESFRKKPCCFPMIDIDCHHKGSYEGAVAFAQYLKDNHFPDLYYEPSTHGKGVQAFFILEKCDYGNELINRILLRRLQPWLRELAKPYDVELVEVKGTLPVVIWGDKHREVLDYTAGTLAKIPRQIASRFDEVKNTTVVSAMDLLRLPEPEKPKKGRGKSAKTDNGSTSGVIVTATMLKGLESMGCYRRAANRILRGEQIRIPGRREVVTRDDLAIFIMLLDAFKTCMNQDGSMPSARIGGLWKALKHEDEIIEGYDPRKIKVMRKLLVALGKIEVEDATFVRPVRDQHGEKIMNGRAMKWQLTQDFVDEVHGVVCKKEGEEEGILGWDSTQPDPFVLLHNCTWRPIEVARLVEYEPDPDELTAQVAFYDLAA